MKTLPKKKLTPQEATAFLKAHEKEQSELCNKEIETALKKYNRQLHVILTMDENEQIRKQIILIKTT